MGGFGSGRSEYATTPTVDESRSLDVDEFTDVVDDPGATGTVWWGDRADGDSVSFAVLSPADHADTEDRARGIRLKYTSTAPRTGEEHEHAYVVPFEYTDCNFGGVRPWFQCPKCGDRVGTIHLPPGEMRFRCRECYDLGYQSSRTSGDPLKQAELRYRRAFAKADAEDRRPHPNNAPFRPERPKGMHHDTFQTLLDDVDEAGREWEQAMREQEKQLLDSLPTPG